MVPSSREKRGRHASRRHLAWAKAGVIEVAANQVGTVGGGAGSGWNERWGKRCIRNAGEVGDRAGKGVEGVTRAGELGVLPMPLPPSPSHPPVTLLPPLNTSFYTKPSTSALIAPPPPATLIHSHISTSSPHTIPPIPIAIPHHFILPFSSSGILLLPPPTFFSCAFPS